MLNVQAAPVGNLLVNGSFEQPSVGVGQFLGATSVPGWTAIPGGTIEIWNAHGGVVATNGTNFLELDWASAYDGFFQDVPTIAGQAYTLQFDTRTRPNLSASTMGIEVLWNGALIATESPTGAWTTRSFTVTGSGGQDRLTIREVSSQSADGLGAMLDNFRLTANGPSNAPPVAGNDTATTNEDVAVAVAVLANDSDPEGQTLTVTHINGTAVAVGGSVDIGPAGVTRNANGTLTVTPDANYNGPVNFTYRVSDGVASADANVAVTVNPLNDAPVVAAPIADQSGVVNQAFSFQVAANAFTDVDNPSLTYSAQLVGGGALPGWLSFTPATRTFSGTPPGTGSLNIQVTASDGTLSATDAFVLNVTASNAPPVAGNDTATTNEDAAVAVAVLANDSDPEGQPLTVTHINGTAVAVGGSVDIGPAGVTRNANGTLTVTPDANYNGPVNFTYRVSDGVASADANVAVTVNPLNDAPVVAAPIADQSGVVNQAFSFQVAANAFTDVDNPSLTYSAQLVGGGALPGWLSFTPATRTFSGTPPGTGPLNIAGDRQRRDALCDRRLRAQCAGRAGRQSPRQWLLRATERRGRPVSGRNVRTRMDRHSRRHDRDLERARGRGGDQRDQFPGTRLGLGL